MTPTTLAQELSFDPMDPHFIKDPYPTLARFRNEAPVYFWDKGKGYVFFRYRDMMALNKEDRLSRDPTLGAGFPDEIRKAFPDFAALRENDLFLVDPASHARMRKLLNPIFGPRAVEVHRPKVTAIIHSLLESLPREGVINAFADFARQYPVRVIAALLNIPSGHEADIIALADALIATLSPNLPHDQFVSYMPAISRGKAIVEACIAERREKPLENDMLSDFIHACDAEERLSQAELLSLIAGLLIAGSDTTVHLTTYALLELHRNPAELALLRAEPSLARGALDETLRYNSFGRAPMARFASEQFSYNDVTFERGSPVYVFTMSAFRDPEFVADADKYDIRRPLTTSPWFGFGPHFCLGVSLARMEAEIALRSFFARYATTELAGEPEYGTHPLMRDIVNLPIRVKAAPDA